ncbi:GNAT family N-acetyltransferase [Sandaracinus amylolyticus]|uniref:GNAT family N-acetyltransferase n=1 Tax=Sandaracinus amylolyticus TaxID=927083 RepID=UPI001F3F681B|nr:GNAT family N-acetyltransferase [Sandaracinus amylolyticus]UJR78314.1 N-acetyltransferase [Sandaracinus amylolyticus]
MTSIRLLAPGDEARAEAFLVAHAESSMFLRANLRAAGLVDEGEPLQGTWAAAFDADRIVAIAAHAWNGMIIVQAPVALPDVVHAVVQATRARGREIAGFAGPHDQTVGAREALGLSRRPTTLDSPERLYALELGAMRVPASLTTGALRVRRTRDDDLDRCASWREDYCVELLGRTRDAALARSARADVELLHRRGNAFVIEHHGEPVAYSAFNARLPDMAQVGGVWTPVALRGRGYARAVVAGSLLVARDEGATRAVLFTAEINVAAQRAYEALGFEVRGAFGLVLFAS